MTDTYTIKPVYRCTKCDALVHENDLIDEMTNLYHTKYDYSIVDRALDKGTECGPVKCQGKFRVYSDGEVGEKIE